MTFLENRNDGSDDRLLPEFPQDVATSLKALSDATNFDFGEPADAGISSIEAPEAPAAIRNVKAPAAIRAIPERKSAELIRTNRVLLGMSFAALVLLGPSFIIGYVFGYGAARSSLPHSASMPAPASSPQNVLPATAVPHQSARAEPPKPAEPVRAKEPNPAQPADRLAAGQ